VSTPNGLGDLGQPRGLAAAELLRELGNRQVGLRDGGGAAAGPRLLENELH
jgi:hypothetical protein